METCRLDETQTRGRRSRALRRQLLWAVPLAALIAAACGDNSDVSDDGNLSGSGSTGNGTGSKGSGAGKGTGGGSGGLLGNFGGGQGLAGDSGTGGKGSVCESSQSDAKLAPIYLGFAFDVSGSMGKLDPPRWWHDPVKKWMPVVEATTAFFEDEDSNNVYASLTFFPAQSQKCEDASYSEPLVPMTALPSTDFGGALDDYEAEVGASLAGGNWRGDTPTLAVVNGTLEYLRAQKAANGDAQVALVLVTDGVPQSCSNNAIEPIADAVEEAFTEDGIRTYVIGVKNPTTPPTSLPAGWTAQGCNDAGAEVNDGEFWCAPPNALASLDQIAAAGDTTAAELIDTDNPGATKTAFARAIAAIRENSVSCDVEIPAHPQGGSFDKDKIDVIYASGKTDRTLSYDPDCDEDLAWHYDDEDDPTSIVLCASACDTIQRDGKAQLRVDFRCEPRPDVLK